MCSVCDVKQGWVDVLFLALALCGYQEISRCIAVHDISWHHTQIRLKKMFDNMRWEAKPAINCLHLAYTPFAIGPSIDDHCLSHLRYLTMKVSSTPYSTPGTNTTYRTLRLKNKQEQEQIQQSCSQHLWEVLSCTLDAYLPVICRHTTLTIALFKSPQMALVVRDIYLNHNQYPLSLTWGRIKSLSQPPILSALTVWSNCFIHAQMVPPGTVRCQLHKGK